MKIGRNKDEAQTYILVILGMEISHPILIIHYIFRLQTYSLYIHYILRLQITCK